MPRAKESIFIKLEREIQAATVAAAIGRSRLHNMIDDGYLYVVEFSSGVVKVGKTTHPKSRLASHAKHAEIHGAEIRRSWTSQRHHGCSASERELIKFCSARGRRTAGREYYRDLSFDDAARYAELLVQREIVQRAYANSGEILAQLEATVNTMLIGCAGDLDMNALEAWRRATEPDDATQPA